MSYSASKNSTDINSSLLAQTTDWPPADCVKPQRNDWCSWLMRWQLYTVRAVKWLSATDCFIWQTFMRSCNCRIFAWHLCCRSHNSFTMRLATPVIFLSSVDELSEGDQANWQVKTAGGKGTSGRHVYKCPVPTTWRVHASAECLSNASVVGTRLYYFVTCRHCPGGGSRWPTAQFRAARVHLGSFHRNPGSLSEIVTPLQGQEVFLFTKQSRPNLGLTQSPIDWVFVALPTEERR